MRPAFLYGRCWRRPYWGASRTRTRPRMCRQSAAADAHDETSRVHATTIEPLADARWAALVDRSLEASPFHHPVWLELRSRTYGYAICAWAVQHGHGRLVRGMPVARVSSWLTGKRLVSPAFSDVCLPLFEADTAESAESVMIEHSVADHEAHGLDVELRYAIAAGGRASLAAHFWHHVIALEADLDAVQRRFSKSQVRRGTSTAGREGVVIRRTTDVGGLGAFDHLHLRTRLRQGVPAQRKRFICGFRLLFEQGRASVALAQWHGASLLPRSSFVPRERSSTNMARPTARTSTSAPTTSSSWRSSGRGAQTEL